MQNVEIVERNITEFKKHNISKEMLLNVTNSIEDTYLKLKLNDLRSYV